MIVSACVSLFCIYYCNLTSTRSVLHATFPSEIAKIISLSQHSSSPTYSLKNFVACILHAVGNHSNIALQSVFQRLKDCDYLVLYYAHTRLRIVIDMRIIIINAWRLKERQGMQGAPPAQPARRRPSRLHTDFIKLYASMFFLEIV
jgi:hypothetical protein